jgi:hypothetical protein
MRLLLQLGKLPRALRGSGTAASTAAAGVFFLTCAAAAAIALVALPAPPAGATQDYARKEGKDCGHCHLNPKGAGPRTATGREYEANGYRFGVKSWTSDAIRDRYLRACAALQATWYAEAARELDAVAKEETLPGGLALVQGTREKFRMFPRAWMTGARKLLQKGEATLPNAYAMLAKVVSQFPATDEGKEAARLLDEAAKEDGKKAKVEEARAAEALRVRFLEGKMLFILGAREDAIRRFDEIRADPRGKAHEKEIAEILAPPEAAPAPGK